MLVNNPISIQGQITRAQDLSMIKQNADNRVAFEQIDIQKQQEDQTENRARQVRQKDDTESASDRHDAREKGSNEYSGDGGQNRKKRDGTVVRKGPGNTEIIGFDIKV